jgi:hypothetical protein
MPAPAPAATIDANNKPNTTTTTTTTATTTNNASSSKPLSNTSSTAAVNNTIRAAEQNALEFDDRSHLYADYLGIANDPHLRVFFDSLRMYRTVRICANLH